MPSQREVIAALSTPGRRTGVVSDFDGVLSPIVPNPDDSRLSPDIEPVLAHLAEHLDLLAILSGRPLDFLLDRVPVPGAAFLGSYGMERRSVEEGGW